MTPTTADPVTPAEIAERIGVSSSDVRAWRTRGQIPEPDWTPRGSAVWAWETLATHPRIASLLKPKKRPTNWLTLVDYAKARGETTSAVRARVNAGEITKAWHGADEYDDWLIHPKAEPGR